MKKQIKYQRECPKCKKVLTYRSPGELKSSEGKFCRPCENKSRNYSGSLNPFYGKKHTYESKQKMKVNRDKSFFQTPSYRAKLSKTSSGKNNGMYGKTVYNLWLEKYGKVEADKRFCNFKKKQSINSSGSNNPMFGKPTPQGSGNGWSGWYKGWFFRSLRELSYVVNTLEKNNQQWISAEKIKIPYINWNNTERNYSPDFLVDSKILIEVKPVKLMNSINVKLKQKAAENHCLQLGWTYLLVDSIKMEIEQIKKMYEAHEIKFTNKYELIYNQNFS